MALTFALTVCGVINVEETSTSNIPPHINSEPNTIAFVDLDYNYTLDATDPDGDKLSFSLLKYPAGMTIDHNSGQISWIPDVEHSYNVIVSASDGTYSTTQSFTLTTMNVEKNIEILFAESLVIDGNLNYFVKDDPTCTENCKRSAPYPGVGGEGQDFASIKSVTGVDIGLISIGSGLEGMINQHDLIEMGKFNNTRAIRSFSDIEEAVEDGVYGVMFYVQRRKNVWQLNGNVENLKH